MNLTKLVKPETVAVVGASEKAGFGGDTTRNYLKFSRNLDGLFFVNPGRDEIYGRKSYKNLSEIPSDVDLVILCTPQNTIISLLKEAAQKNCGGAVVFASGYGEAGAEGKALQQELVECANTLNIAVMGPNCAGFANFIDGIFAYAFPFEERDRGGDIGIVSQSGQVVLSALDNPKMGFSYAFSSGNSCNVSVEDYLNFLVDDSDTKVVAAYMEGVREPKKFVSALQKAAQKKKPVVILKTGRSIKSQELACSHTGSLSGSDQVLRAVFKRYGVFEASDLEELYGISTALSWISMLPKGKRCVFMNVSGGEAGITADLADKHGITLAEYKPETVAYLKTLLPSYGSVNNPFDMTAEIGYNVPVMCKAMRAISEDDQVDAICVAYTITPEVWDATISSMVEAVRIVGAEPDVKPIFWLPFAEHTRNPECAGKLRQAGAALLSTGEYGCSALRKILDYSVFRYEEAGGAIPERCHNAAYGLSEYDSLRFLSNHGVHIPPMAVAATREEAAEAAEKLGYPISAKIHSADIQHKSDVGGVKLGIQNSEALCLAFDEIMESCAQNAPSAKLSGVLLKPMLKKGAEMIIGVNNDPDFGPMVMVGMGGVFVELFKDVQLAPAPLTKVQAESMIRNLRAYPLLDGYRGTAMCDKAALADLIVKISEIAALEKDYIKELDINPVFVTEDGAAIADALLVVYGLETDV